MSEKGALTINLMGREFRVACPEGEERSLLASVEYVNRKMKEIRDTGKVVGNERVALLAALNIAHEFLSNPGKSSGAGGRPNTFSYRNDPEVLPGAADRRPP